MEGSGKQPMTESTRKELKAWIEINMQNSTEFTDLIRRSINLTKWEIQEAEKKNGSLLEDNILKRKLVIQNFTLLLQLCGLDLFCAFNFYLDSNYKYEGIYSSKMLIITVHEASKKIFHFNSYRSSSIWGKDIKNIVECLMPSLIIEYNKIDDMIEELDEIYSEFEWRKKRNTLVHYEDNPSEVYDLLVGLSIEEVAKRVMKFIRVEIEMMEFSHKLTSQLHSILKQTTI